MAGKRLCWNPERILTFGFSGGAMQSLYLAALDDRIHAVFLSGYMYGFRDSLLQMNRNCSCNYVPHLMEHFDIRDKSEPVIECIGSVYRTMLK